MRKILAVAAILALGPVSRAACTATEQSADYSPVGGATATLANGILSDGQTHKLNVSANGNLLAISAWCYTHCSFPSTIPVDSQVATLTSVVTPGNAVDGGNPGLFSGQAGIYYLLNANAGNHTATFTPTNLTSPQQTQLSYIDFKPSSGCIFSHHLDSAVGSSPPYTGIATAPSVTNVTGDVLFAITVTTQHVVSPSSAPWSCPTYSGSGETQNCEIDVTRNGASYVLSAASGTVSNNWNLINSSTGYEALISAFSMTQLVANSCPNAVSYRNPSDPTGSRVTLTSLGITTCYYVSDSGSDLNSGAYESAAFLHAPGMGNCSNNCSKSLLTAGIGIIFRGGDTWHFGNSAASPYTGIVSACYINGTLPGNFCLADLHYIGSPPTSTHPLYVGVDPSWFNGGSWTRPIFTADNSPCSASTVGTMPDGFTCSAGTDVWGDGQPVYVVSGCAYQTSSVNNLVEMNSGQNIILDNIEMTGLCQSHKGQPGGDDSYLEYGAQWGPNYILNDYIHGASHLQYAAANGSGGCTASTVCINLNAFYGNASNTTVGETIAFTIVDFSDSDPVGENLCQCSFYNEEYNVFRYTTQAIPGYLHAFHDNDYEYFFENGHSNMIEDAETPGGAVYYNNIFRHVETYITSSSPNAGGVLIWPGPTASSDVAYVFNNLFADVGFL